MNSLFDGSQIMPNFSVDSINERSSWVKAIEFTDENGDLVVATSASYRIDDVGSDAQIRDDTEVSLNSPPGTDAEINLNPSDTVILDEVHLYETRRLTVTWLFGNDSPTKQKSAEYLFNVVNLKGITAPSPA